MNQFGIWLVNAKKNYLNDSCESLIQEASYTLGKGAKLLCRALIRTLRSELMTDEYAEAQAVSRVDLIPISFKSKWELIQIWWFWNNIES